MLIAGRGFVPFPGRNAAKNGHAQVRGENF
jgi:hypothetical protein